MKLVLSALAAFLVAYTAHAALDGSSILAFEATSLSGKKGQQSTADQSTHRIDRDAQ